MSKQFHGLIEAPGILAVAPQNAKHFSAPHIRLDRARLRVLACAPRAAMNPAGTDHECFLISDDYEALSRQAADRMLAALADQPDLLLWAAGGSTPERAYQLLVEHHRRRPADFTALRLVQLDEWGGLPANDPGLSRAVRVVARESALHRVEFPVAVRCQRLRGLRCMASFKAVAPVAQLDRAPAF